MDAKQGASNPINVERRYNYTQKIQLLETFFMGHPNPNDEQIDQLSREVDFDPEQIKVWFENRKAEEKTIIELAEIEALRAENERIRRENDEIQEKLRHMTCNACQETINSPGPISGEKD